MLGHPAAGLGPGWVLLGAFWAMQPHFGALREALGRHLEANAGLGSSDMEHPCGKMAIWPKLQKHIENSIVFEDFWEAGGARRRAKMRLRSFGGRLLVCLAGFGNRVAVDGPAESQHEPFWAHLGPSHAGLGWRIWAETLFSMVVPPPPAGHVGAMCMPFGVNLDEF